nr:MAG TPA: hypothetical protein [Caudoviricetes sp.]
MWTVCIKCAQLQGIGQKCDKRESAERRNQWKNRKNT